MSHTISSLKQEAKKVAGRACPYPPLKDNKDPTRVQYIRMEGGLVRRTKLKAALIVLKDKPGLRIEVDDHPSLGPPMLVFSWTCGPVNVGALRLRLWQDEDLNQWKAA